MTEIRIAGSDHESPISIQSIEYHKDYRMWWVRTEEWIPSSNDAHGIAHPFLVQAVSHGTTLDMAMSAAYIDHWALRREKLKERGLV